MLVMKSILKFVLAIAPLIPSVICFVVIHSNDGQGTFIYVFFSSVIISILGYAATSAFIPTIGEFTLKKGICGKDLGKKGQATESKDIPEALGIVCGTVYLVCTILSQLVFAKSEKQLIVYNTGLFSICFMIFLGFMDDTLDLKWRYKLLLPTIASLPLLSTYSGSTAMFVPKPFSSLLMANNNLTLLGSLINVFATVDTEAMGSIVELGSLFLLFMGLQAVFCTNAINILAGINGLECGQSYIIACSILFFKMYEISLSSEVGEYEIFAILFILPFIGTTLGILRHNWYPASVFVGDTYCYFAGMTFAVVGIHSHFSKTLLMLFIPQIINFVYSVPQLFKFMPCPRHRLPKVDTSTGLMYPSTFPCKENEYRLFKVRRNDTECPNCTIICLVLRICGPMKEESLCVTLLAVQVLSTVFAFFIRYYLLELASS